MPVPVPAPPTPAAQVAEYALLYLWNDPTFVSEEFDGAACADSENSPCDCYKPELVQDSAGATCGMCPFYAHVTSTVSAQAFDQCLFAQPTLAGRAPATFTVSNFPRKISCNGDQWTLELWAEMGESCSGGDGPKSYTGKSNECTEVGANSRNKAMFVKITCPSAESPAIPVAGAAKKDSSLSTGAWVGIASGAVVAVLATAYVVATKGRAVSRPIM